MPKASLRDRSFYLDHKEEIDSYIVAREKETAQIRQEMEALFPSRGLRGKLLARLEEKMIKLAADENFN